MPKQVRALEDSWRPWRLREKILLVALGLMTGLGAHAAGPVVITSPKDGATIPSGFVALAGEAPAGFCFAIDRNDQRIGRVCADDSGHFDKVIRAGQGSQIFRIFQTDSAALTLGTLRISSNPPQDRPYTEGPWDLLEEGDVILSQSEATWQESLYNPRYTHAALYLGAGPDGSAQIAEAVDEESAGGAEEIRAVPIEQTREWHTAQSVDIYRFRGGLQATDREALLTFVRGVVNRHLKYWTMSAEFAAMYTTWLQWDARRDRPVDAARFQQSLDRLHANKFSLEKFNCATLVWRAFWEGSKGRIDLADPNRIEFGGQLAHSFTPAFLELVRPYFLGPDTLYRSGKLEIVTGTK